jgi:hypothetical protein
MLLCSLALFGCSQDKQPQPGKLEAHVRLVPYESILEIGIVNYSERNLWLESGSTRMNLSYEVYKDGKLLISAVNVDTPPYQENGGLNEMSYLPRQSPSNPNEQYIVQFGLDQNIWKDFEIGDEVRIGLLVKIHNESRKNPENFEFPYQRIHYQIKQENRKN